MLLDIGVLGIDRLVEHLLGMGSSHVRTLPSFCLDRVPGIPSRSCGYYAESSDVRTVQGDVSSGELVTESPLVKTWTARVDRCRCGGRGIRGLEWSRRLSNLPVDIAHETFGREELGHVDIPC